MNIYKFTLFLQIIVLIWYWINPILFVEIIQAYGNIIGIFLIIYFFIFIAKVFNDLANYAYGDDNE